MNIKERTENLEKKVLSKYASFSSESKGRLKQIHKCQVRTEFQRDRDRIIHSKSFRRLKHKTQVFIAPGGDHYRTRLTHTLEVAQIGRTIARGLRLNEDLTEAIALGHDLGHTPFGHAGEKVLNSICPYGFRHYEQSLRVVDYIENDGEGMNLTYEVRDGIKNHTGDNMASTLEGIIIKYADRIAYINHDIDDALRGGIIKTDDIPKRLLDVLGKSHGERINTMITDIIYNSIDKNKISMTKHINNAMMSLREFMFENVYVGSNAKAEEKKVKEMIEYLYNYFLNHPEKLPDIMKQQIKQFDIHRAVCDYIAGMTDRYAIYIFSNIVIPKPWNKI